MSNLLGRSAAELWDSSNSNTRPRRVGEYLLVGQLGDDALGSVYRALHSCDGRFVRLRVLQSPELSPTHTLAAAKRQMERRLATSAVSRHGELHIADGTPYLVWPDRSGWTLDFVLARARAGGWGMPIEFALWIAERAAEEIERVSRSAGEGEPSDHGALWPGFVSVSSDAEVSVEGFGLAEVVLPALSHPRMWRDIAPYIAPEVRESGRPCASSDVYSIGVLLTELLTGQRASADMPPPHWRADDDFSQEVCLLLRFALSQRSERFASLKELRACLAELIASCPFETSPADLALFLYELLNPESRLLPAPFDGSATNPLPDDSRRAASPEKILPPTSLLPFPEVETPPAVLEDSREERPSLVCSVFGVAPAAGSISLIRWTSRAAAIAAAITGLFLVNLAIRRAPLTPIAAERHPWQAYARPSLSAVAAIGIVPSVAIVPRGPARNLVPRAPRRLVVRAASARRQPDVRPQAETLRLKAALARIEAERLDAPLHAADTFLQARAQEREAEELLTRSQFAAARDAYAHALDLFTEAWTRSREERVRQIQIASDASGAS